MTVQAVLVKTPSDLICETPYRKVWQSSSGDSYKTRSMWHDGTSETRTLSREDTVKLLKSAISELQSEPQSVFRVYDREALASLLGAELAGLRLLVEPTR